MALKIFLVLTLMAYQLAPGTGQGEEPEPEPVNKFTTCDFDLLEDQPDILEFLSEECQDVYNKADAELIMKMNYEASRFGEFMNELGQKEGWKEQATDEDIEFFQWDFDLRERVYNGTNLNCTGISESFAEFIDCKSTEREAMIAAIMRSE
ncbi:hypothetical protein Bhyg_04854 [Pseudolycoriella hygida]|uniref:Uncharacterized protein n=1 Tax=Pseudolycoriella hygida TaxID=35572 RepID=A0A9Q0NFY8_9DIPT|nr:hypothetical protein Bhyg_04854 [Pseudolycoriella hygida]